MDLMNVKCPNCSGSVTFEDGSNFAVCDYCRAKLNFQRELANFHEENHDELEAVSARVIDLISDGNFLQAETAIKDALLKYPYAGRLHVYMLMCEFAVSHPEELAEKGKDFTNSSNYQKCLRYMLPEDKKDLMTLVGKLRESIGNTPIADDIEDEDDEKAPLPQPTEDSFKKKEKPVIAPQIIDDDDDDEDDDDDDDYYDDEDEDDDDNADEDEETFYKKPNKKPITKPKQKPTKKKGKSKPKQKKGIGNFFATLVVLLFIAVGAYGAYLAAYGGSKMGNYILLIAGILQVIIAIILYIVYEWRAKIFCPVCGTRRVHHREWIRTDVKYGYNNSETEINIYRDTFECPECGELKIETVKKPGEIKEF